jgi:hypothetical protein
LRSREKREKEKERKWSGYLFFDWDLNLFSKAFTLVYLKIKTEIPYKNKNNASRVKVMGISRCEIPSQASL